MQKVKARGEKLKPVRSIRCSKLGSNISLGIESPRAYLRLRNWGRQSTKTETIYEVVATSALKQPLEEPSWLLATGSKGHFLGGRSTIDRALRVAMGTRGRHFTEKKQTASL